LDLVTPARTWAYSDSQNIRSEDGPAADRMPVVQQIVMLLSVGGPLVGLAAACALLWGRSSAGGLSGPVVVVTIVMYILTGFGVTIGFHRLLTHRSFETPRPVRLLLAILGSAAAQGMVVKWCATHRRHHQHSDRPGDPHSPRLHGNGMLQKVRGFWHAHMGWCFNPDQAALARSVPDLVNDPALMLIDQLYFFWVFLGIFIPAVVAGLYLQSWQGFVSGMLWGGLVRIALMQHVTWSINSVCHVWGTRPFRSADHSTNNFPLAILSLGEGWHNNHHAFPTSARHGLRWWEFDASYHVIKLMSLLGLAHKIRVPASDVLEAKRVPSASPGVLR
jgi:stearoyl-CoA desaturase (delta-9 desaturase)